MPPCDGVARMEKPDCPSTNHFCFYGNVLDKHGCKTDNSNRYGTKCEFVLDCERPTVFCDHDNKCCLGRTRRNPDPDVFEEMQPSSGSPKGPSRWPPRGLSRFKRLFRLFMRRLRRNGRQYPF